MSDSFDDTSNMQILSSPEVKYEGVTFENMRAALAAVFFLRENMPLDEWRQALQYVLPMQHNFQNPIKPGTQDTWIQFWINEDDRVIQDHNVHDDNRTLKVAHITVRFLGRRAETWAKAFHHLTKRKSVASYFVEYCNAQLLEYISPITPQNVDYFGVGNTTIAFDISFYLEYVEYMELNWEPLEFISIPPGEIIEGPEGFKEQEEV